jgi:hypothetical protein
MINSDLNITQIVTPFYSFLLNFKANISFFAELRAFQALFPMNVNFLLINF